MYTEAFPITEYTVGSVVKIVSNPFPFNNRFWVHDCSFSSLTSYEGGAIMIANVFSQLLVSDCVFYAISITGSSGYNPAYGYYTSGNTYYAHGACIGYYNPTYSVDYPVIKRICAYRCNARVTDGWSASGYNFYSYGHFCFIQVHSSSKIDVNETSILECSTSKTTGRYICYLYNGRITFNSDNITKSFAKSDAGLYTYGTNNCSIQFCTFLENSANENRVITINNNGDASLTSRILSSNFVNNTQPSTTDAVIYISCSNVIFDGCVFLVNDKTKPLFYKPSGSTIIINSYLSDHICTGVAPIYHNTLSSKPTLSLSHFGTAFCEIPTPDTNPEEVTYTYALPPTPPQSIPLTPTECLYSDNGGKLFSLANILQLSLTAQATLVLL